ncbi:hypothetical protein A3K73_03185 [Candidatus Pacearchaeota archaeon RBG_13_36_9]|nr:MAG: hypothetical protein A3K73_03185 [Candidatus Pacearchaeota archaeon RBG_13_36_9]
MNPIFWDRIPSFRENEAYKTSCTTNRGTISSALGDIETRISQASWREHRQLRGELIKLSKKIQGSKLFRDDRLPIWEKLQAQFDALKGAEDALEQRLEEEYERRKLDMKSNREAVFTDIKLPELRLEKPKQTERERVSITTDLKPLLDIYPLIFPEGSEFRAQQIQYMAMCYEGVTHGKDVVIEGPTGLGKTRGLIGASLQKIMNNPKTRMLYTTRTVAQVNNIMREVKEVLSNASLEGIDATLHLGTGSIKSLACNSFDPDIRDDEDQCNPCSEDLKRTRFRDTPESETRVVDLDFLRVVRKDGKCPLPVFRKKSESSRITVSPFAYLFDSFWVSRYFGATEPEDKVLVIDEAHNFLEDLSSKPYLQFNIGAHKRLGFFERENRISNSYNLESIVDSIRKGLKKYPLETKIGGVGIWEAFTSLLAIENQLKEGIARYWDKEHVVSEGQENGSKTYIIAENDMVNFVNSLGKGFQENLSKIKAIIELHKEEIATEDEQIRRKIEPSLCSYHQIVSALEDVTKEPYGFLITSDEEKIRFYSLDPKKRAEYALKDFGCKIFTSATLSPPEDVAYLLGLEDCLRSKIQPVFRDENYLPIVIAGVNSSRKKDSNAGFTKEEQEVLQELFVRATREGRGKNIGVFCTSNNAVIDVHYILQDLKDATRALILTYVDSTTNSDDSYAVRLNDIKDDYEEACRRVNASEELRVNPSVQNKIDVFKKMGGLEQTAILLGVQGGRLSEGMNYVRDQMEMVIAVGLPYPNSASDIKINEVKANYFYMKLGDKEFGVDLAYRQSAFRKLAQSLGRVHRQMSDRGVLIIADERVMAIKNTANEGHARYEFLSIRNAKNNLQILQRPFKDHKILVFPGKDPREERMLKNYVSSGFASPESFASFQEMSEAIRRFYKNG